MKGGYTMANDTLKNKIRFSSTLTPEVEKLLKDYSKQSMIPISKIIEAAIVEYVKNNPIYNS